MGKRKNYQYNFEDVYGERWMYDPEPIRAGGKDSQLNLSDYYDKSILGEQTKEDVIVGKMKQLPKCRIMLQTIECGDRVELNIYPWFMNRRDIPRSPAIKESREAQKRLNRKNSQKRLIRLMCCNFHDGDLILTLTYGDYFYPTREQAQKDIRDYVKALRRERKKEGLGALKYIYVTEYVPEGEGTKKVRIHHHIIINRMDRDMAESLWKKGRAQAKYAQTDDFELEGFARYISKLSYEKNHHAWVASRNLDKPVEHKSTTLLSRRKFAEIIRSGDKGELLESLYQGKLKYLDSTVYINQEYGGFYLYSRMRRKESVWDRQETAEPVKPDCRVFLGYDWEGPFAHGGAVYSILLEAYRKDGTPETREYYGHITGTTRGRLILRMAKEALGKLRPCCVEFHSPGKVLADGISGGQFALRRKDGYRGVKNADLVEGFMQAAEGFTMAAVSEKKNEYSEAMKFQRELRRKKLIIKEDRASGQE